MKENLENQLQQVLLLEKERDELLAHCEFLKECCYMLGNGMKVEKDEIDSLPSHSLSKIQTQSIEKMVKDLTPMLDDKGRLFDYEILEYANIISQK